MNDEYRDAAPFRYTYAAPSAEERREIEAIRSEYLPATGSGKIAELQRLHARATGIPKLAAAHTGVCGCLLFGLGLAMIMEWKLPAGGAAVAVFGTAFMALAYFVYRALLRRYRAKYGPKILRLSEELLNENERGAQP